MPDSATHWRDVHFVVPLQPEQAVPVLRLFATMAGSPRLVLEADGSAGRLAWRIGGSDAALRRVAALFAVELPGTMLAMSAQRAPVSGAVKLSISRHRGAADCQRAHSRCSTRRAGGALCRADWRTYPTATHPR
jgi:hypothetical protein